MVDRVYEERRARWTNTFKTPDGKEVLKDILEECHVFETIEPGDEGALAMRNYGLSVMVMTGILEVTEDNDPLARMVNMVH